MRLIKKRWRALLAVLIALQLAACSKTVQWEEEVPLNTGEVIWVKRTVVYAAQGGAGHPLDIKYRPGKDQAIEFTWNGKTYHYKGEAQIMLLAISSKGQPAMVAPAEDNSWNRHHKYPCTVPFYVQFVPDETGKHWTWPASIDSWLYNLPSNLLQDTGDPKAMRVRYTQAEKLRQPYLADPYAQYFQKVVPAFTGDLCKKKEK
jgi:hypothetical protein